jgi:hypothetical protein
MKLNNCTHFYCNSCTKIRPLAQAHQVKVAWPIFDRGNEDKLIYNKATLLICDKCFNEEEEDKK